MAQAIRVGSLEIAAITAVNGDNQGLERLEKISEGKSAAELGNAIGVVVNSSNGDEAGFNQALNLLARGSAGLEALKRYVIDGSSRAAVNMVNDGFQLGKNKIDFVSAMQKSDFFAICANGDNDQVVSAIKQIDFRLACKIRDENGRSACHIAILNPKVEAKTFADYGFDFNCQDKSGVTPFMLLCKHNAGAALEVLKNKALKIDLAKRDEKGLGASDYCEDKRLKEFLQKMENKTEAKVFVRQSKAEAAISPSPSVSPKAVAASPALVSQAQKS